MDPGKLIGAEILVALSINSWGAIKAGQAPWPPTIIGSMVAYCILLLLSAVSAPLAAILATGFLLALLIGNLDGAQGGSIATKFGALPPQGVGFDILHFRATQRPLGRTNLGYYQGGPLAGGVTGGPNTGVTAAGTGVAGGLGNSLQGQNIGGSS